MNAAFLTVVTMCAFAANSFLCRAALGTQQIDPVSFTAVRLAGGALTLCLLVVLGRGGSVRKLSGSWPMALALLGYALFFSLAYIQLSTGTGALILFGFVQLSMLAWAFFNGDRLRGWRLGGAVTAIGGLLVLLWPKLQVPDSLLAAVSMAVAGMSWAVYSVLGKGSSTPLLDTCGNFVRAGAVMASLWLLVMWAVSQGVHLPGVTVLQGLAFPKVILPEPTLAGIGLALASGCLASGLGYALWYRVLPRLPVTSAASVQLSVPVIAALAGLLLAEPLTLHLMVAMSLTLGGIALVVLRRPG